MYKKLKKHSNYMNKENNKIFLLIFAVAFILSLNFIFAETNNYAPVKVGDCINIQQTCGTCTYLNVTISYPNSTRAINNEPMTVDGGVWNYTFCNTTTLGRYDVNTCGDLNSIFQCNEAGTLWFIVNGSGQEINQSQVNLIIIGLVVLFIVTVFFFVLAMIFKHPGPKIFLMALCAGTLIILVGLVASNSSSYLAEFSGLSHMFNGYYVLLTILGGTALLGIVIWLIYYATTAFNKTRGRIVDDE